jgi:enoyl-CoA hydratase/carnithine racemase
VNLTDILYEKHDYTAAVTFNRPESLNAFRDNTFRELLHILEDVDADDQIRTVILTGKGRAFCAGEDLKSLQADMLQTLSLKQARDSVLILQDITRRIIHSPKIFIAAINGISVGFGVEISIASDVRIASENAAFMFAEVKRGLFQTNGVMYLLPRMIGHGRALDLMLTGDKIDAHTALEMGIVTKVVPPEQLMDAARDKARVISANAPIPVRLVKQIMHRAHQIDLEAAMQLEVDGVMQCMVSEDLTEGLRSFIEKRPPVYKGK